MKSHAVGVTPCGYPLLCCQGRHGIPQGDASHCHAATLWSGAIIASSRGSETTVAICPKHPIVPGSCPRTAFRLRRPSITPYRHCSSSRGSETTVAICFKHPILPRSCPRTAFHRARPISHGDLRSKPMLGEDAGTIDDATCSCKVRRPCKVFDRRSLHIIEMGHHFNSPILVCIGRKAGLHDQCCSLPRC